MSGGVGGREPRGSLLPDYERYLAADASIVQRVLGHFGQPQRFVSANL